MFRTEFTVRHLTLPVLQRRKLMIYQRLQHLGGNKHMLSLQCFVNTVFYFCFISWWTLLCTSHQTFSRQNHYLAHFIAQWWQIHEMYSTFRCARDKNTSISSLRYCAFGSCTLAKTCFTPEDVPPSHCSTIFYSYRYNFNLILLSAVINQPAASKCGFTLMSAVWKSHRHKSSLRREDDWINHAGTPFCVIDYLKIHKYNNLGNVAISVPAHSAFRDAVRKLNQGVLYLQNSLRFHGTFVHAILFMLVRKVRCCLIRSLRNS